MTHVLLRSGIPKQLLSFLSKGMEQRPYFRRNMGSLNSCSNSGHDLNVTDPIRRLCADDIPWLLQPVISNVGKNWGVSIVMGIPNSWMVYFMKKHGKAIHKYTSSARTRRGGSCLRLRGYIRLFSSIELACAVRQPSPCVRAFCESGVLFHMSHLKLHFALHTSHCTLYTSRFTLRTSHFSLHSSHSTLHASHSTLHTAHCTLRTPHFTSHCTLKTPHFTLHTSHFTVHTSHFSLLTAFFTLHTSWLFSCHLSAAQLFSSHRS